MIKILIADDHTTVRTGLKQILVEEADVSEVGEARNAHEAIDLVRSRRWDLVVTDISMPGRGGLELLKEIKSEQPKLPVLVLSMHPEEQYAVRALKAGASGYMLKRAAAQELIHAIRMVAVGGVYLDPALAAQEEATRASVFSVVTPERLWEGPFIYPASGPISSPYGIGRSAWWYDPVKDAHTHRLQVSR